MNVASGSERMVEKLGTRRRILVTSLLLFNEHGEPNTTTNEIADELDISPGNLHYHFRRKSDLVHALVEEFRCDADKILVPPESDSPNIEDLWFFLHILLECTSAYRFIFRDIETLVATYPKVANAVKRFISKLRVIVAWYLDSLVQSGNVDLRHSETAAITRNLSLIVLFSDQFDDVVGETKTPSAAATRTARAAFEALLPYLKGDARHTIWSLLQRYQ
jgi:AcrR family transcriptional regulator